MNLPLTSTVDNTAISDGSIYQYSTNSWNKIHDLTPLHHYKLNEASGNITSDSGSNPIVGSITSCVLSQAGKIDKCMQFTGTASYIDTVNTWVPASNSFSFAAWVKPSDASANKEIIYSAVGNNGCILRYNSNSVTWLVGTGTGYSGISSPCSQTVWSHIAGVVSNSKYQLYNNGRIYIEGSTITGLSGTQNIMIGAATGSSYFNGYIEDVRIYNKALTQQEVQSIYNQGRGTYDDSFKQGFPTVKPPTHHWKLQELSGNIANDSGSSPIIGSITSCTLAQSGFNRDTKSYLFTGTASYINCGSDTSMNFTTSPFSMSFWTKPYVVNTFSVLFNKGSAATGGYYVYQNSNTTLGFATNNSGQSLLPSTQFLTTSSWSHVVVMYANSSGSIYVNGSLNAATTAMRNPASTNNSFILGAYPDVASITAGYYYNGNIADFRVYDYALSADEVRNIYNLGKGTLLT